MAESELYSEFAKLAENKTSLFITHRLDEVMAASNSITILRDGKLAATADMWKAQKQWYQKKWAQKKEVKSP